MAAGPGGAALGLGRPITMRVWAVADTDSQVKWGAAVLDALPPEWRKTLTVLATPASPSPSQLAAALDGSPFAAAGPTPQSFKAFLRAVREHPPDVVLVALRGPAVHILIRAIEVLRIPRPVFVSGVPGIAFPASRRTLEHRREVDLFLVHGKREGRDFRRIADELGIQQRFALTTLAYLPPLVPIPPPAQAPVTGTILFAAQSGVPATKEDRLSVLGWLSQLAAERPECRVVVKLRAVAGEHQTHVEAHPYDVLAEEFGELPPNLVFETGPMGALLDRAAALVTVGSTAALEAAGRRIPTLVLGDFGVSAQLQNLVFEHSGLLGSSRDLVAGRFLQADPGWLDDNYFHDPRENSWIEQIAALVASAQRGEPSATRKPEARSGWLRRARDRRRMFGRYPGAAASR